MGQSPLHATFSIRPSVSLSVRPCVRRAPYFRNRNSCDYNFWYTCIKWWYLQDFFFFFFNFDFSGWKGSKRAKNSPKWKNNNYIRHTPPYHRNSNDHDFWCTCAKWWYLQAFFHFFKILIFQIVSGIKEQKMAQNHKNFCLLWSISQEPYTIWMLFIVHFCKMMVSPSVFFIFSKFWFSGLLGG